MENLAALLEELNLPYAHLDAKQHNLKQLHALLQANRPLLLAKLKTLGIDKIGDRQKVANALARAAKDERIASADDDLSYKNALPHLEPATWSQTDDTLTIRLAIPLKTPSAKITFSADVNSVEVLLDGEQTAVVGRLHGFIRPADSTWTLERAPEAEPAMFQARDAPTDSVVVTLAKSRPGEWVGLFVSGSGATAKKERPPPPPPTDEPRQASRAGGGVGFVPRKLKLGGRRGDGSRDRHRATEGPPNEERSAPAADYWDPRRAHCIWRAGCTELRGEPSGPSMDDNADGPWYDWVETPEAVVLRARTRKGLTLQQVRLHAEPRELELHVDGAPTPWCGRLCGLCNPDSCHARILAEGEHVEWDTLELTIAKAEGRLWRAPFEGLLADVEVGDARRALPRREALSSVNGSGWQHAQQSDSWSVVVPIVWKPIAESAARSGRSPADDLLVAVSPNGFNVHVAGQLHAPIVGGELYGRVLPELCSYSVRAPRPGMEEGELSLKLVKDTARAGVLGHWADLIMVHHV